MNNLFKEASNFVDVFIENENEISFFYRGYKITKFKQTDEVSIFDTRVCDLYIEVHGKLLYRFINNGFERTCDELQVYRDTRRMNISNYYIMKAIVNNDYDKKEKLQEDRLNLMLKIKNINNKTYEK